MSFNNTVGEKLNALLQKNIEAREGFHKAAEKMENPAIQSFFNNKSRERNTFAHQLESHINQFNVETEDDDGLKAKAHRTWMDIKTMLASDQEEAVLEEVIRGEKAIIEQYEEVLEDTAMPLPTRNLVTTQLNTIKSGMEIVEKMEATR